MRVAVVGCGAVGSVIAVAASRGGASVYCIARRAVGCREERIVVEGFGSSRLAVCGWDAAAAVNPDVVVYAVKAYDLPGALEQGIKAGWTGGLSVSLQNGLGSLELLEERLPGRAACGIVYFGSTLLGRLHARLAGRGPLLLGSRVRLAPDAEALLKDLALVLAAGGLEARLEESIEGHRWLKLAVNAAVNPVTVMAWAPNHVIIEDPDAGRLAERLALEVGRVAEALGIGLPGDPLEALWRTVEATGDNCSSMLQDVALRGRSEVDYINGAVAAAARDKGLEAPYNEAAWRAVRLLQRWLAGRRLPCGTY